MRLKIKQIVIIDGNILLTMKRNQRTYIQALTCVSNLKGQLFVMSNYKSTRFTKESGVYFSDRNVVLNYRRTHSNWREEIGFDDDNYIYNILEDK
jgi:hypothetical protein